MKMKHMLPYFLAAACCLLVLVSCRQEPDSGAGPVAPVDVKVYGKLAAVLGHESKKLELVDPGSGKVVKSISLSGKPNGMAIDGNIAYVAEGGPGGMVEVVALDTGTVKGAFPAGHTPMSPVVLNGKLYVAARFDSKIVEMDASSGKC